MDTTAGTNKARTTQTLRNALAKYEEGGIYDPYGDTASDSTYDTLVPSHRYLQTVRASEIDLGLGDF